MPRFEMLRRAFSTPAKRSGLEVRGANPYLE